MPRVAPSRKPVARPPAAGRAGVCVVGALTMDLIVKTETIPGPGQSVPGRDLLEVPGGRGANQAAAVGRLWARPPRRGAAPACRLIGRVGHDALGGRITAGLGEFHVDTAHVLATRDAPTGVALIAVDRHGESASVVAGGANARLSSTDLLAHRAAITQCAVLLVQLETPFDTIACAVALAKQAGALAILDPAPAPAEGMPESLFHVDILCPNQDEALLLSGVRVLSVDDARRAGEIMLARGTGRAIIKMGAAGAVLVRRSAGGAPGVEHIPGFKVPVVDTTAAGDAFAGALAVALAEGRPLPEAVRFANAAGAVTCTRAGGPGRTSDPGRG